MQTKANKDRGSFSICGCLQRSVISRLCKLAELSNDNTNTVVLYRPTVFRITCGSLTVGPVEYSHE